MEKKFYEGLTGGLGRSVYTRRYIPPHPDPWTVRRCTTSDGPMVHRDLRRFWRRIGHKVTRDLSVSLSVALPPPTRAPSPFARQPELLKVILPSVKATQTPQKQYDFIARPNEGAGFTAGPAPPCYLHAALRGGWRSSKNS